MNVTLRGRTRQILENMVSEGYANTMSEAIRLTILNFGDKHISEEERLVGEKLDRIDKEIREGKRKVLNTKQALGKYAKYVK